MIIRKMIVLSDNFSFLAKYFNMNNFVTMETLTDVTVIFSLQIAKSRSYKLKLD